ncbi:BhlA/UviB family holin-like peptide [Alkaliphilus peptidifermentans]|uniref:BhlA holin family protein n=1 Tax=Alkaliphilus peptidifermentans DSM 18978 TaxID=1120976 RepID=A0A1G5AAQ6_9FIRM|nr:BhlA/UviB family holin-like peptide [Alkaliphilus peptidifermentans]SCX74952.1 BhlA holin family protein [Alkaliphilus peptidifermentans DSM 18978]
MENDLLRLASTQGLWAALSVLLILYILRAQEKRDVKQEQREQKYQEIICSLTDKLNLIEDANRKIEIIEKHVLNIKS